jgi:hypothetical protein
MTNEQMASKVKSLIQELLDVTVAEHVEGKLDSNADMIWNEIVELLNKIISKQNNDTPSREIVNNSL